jgi:hypothetical protein
LPEDFYAHRSNIDYNANHLSNFFSYNRFLFSHIDNLAIASYYENNAYHSQFDRHTINYNKSKLDIIDRIITDKIIRNNLLKYKARDYVSHNHTEDEANEILDYYLEKSTNEEDKTNLRDLVSSLKLLRNGNPLPNLELVNYNNTEHRLNSIITRPTITW